MVVGGGSWGCALAQVLADNEHRVQIYMRNEEQRREFNKSHSLPRFLPGVSFSQQIEAVADLNQYDQMDFIVFALPTQSIRGVLEEHFSEYQGSAIFVNVAKGLELRTHKRISEIFSEYIPLEQYVCLSGPTHAEEVAIHMPSTIVSSSVSEQSSERVQDLFMNSVFRVYTNSDLIGVELGGATKNVLALGLGVASGLGFGDNTMAALMTRGMHEIVRFGTAMGGNKETFYGLTGMGDLIVTATSQHSRNRRAGVLLGQGYSLQETTHKVNMVVEGVMTCKALYEQAQVLGVDMPITREIYGVLYEDLDVAGAVERLMEREKKRESLD